MLCQTLNSSVKFRQFCDKNMDFLSGIQMHHLAIRHTLSIKYSVNLNTNHLNTKLFEVHISNGIQKVGLL